MVPALPEIVVRLEGYRVTLNDAITVTQGRSVSQGTTWDSTTTATHSRTREDNWEVGIEAEVGFEFPGVKATVKAHANYGGHIANTHETSNATSCGGSLVSTEEWSQATTTNPTEAAKIKLFLKVYNQGSACASNVVPTLTLRIGGHNVATFKPGENHPTRRDLDVAISGDGFLTVRKPDGELAYTRDGQLRVRADRTLVNSQGLEILSELGNPIQLQSQGGSPVILPDGTIRQGDTVIGMLGIANTADPSRLIPLAGGLFAPGAGAAMKPVEKPVVQQGYLESSNVAPLREMVDLVSIARAYEANQKLIQTRDKLMGTTIETFS